MGVVEEQGTVVAAMSMRECRKLVKELLELTKDANTADTVVGGLLERLIEIDQSNPEIPWHVITDDDGLRAWMYGGLDGWRIEEAPSGDEGSTEIKILVYKSGTLYRIYENGDGGLEEAMDYVETAIRSKLR